MNNQLTRSSGVDVAVHFVLVVAAHARASIDHLSSTCLSLEEPLLDIDNERATTRVLGALPIKVSIEISRSRPRSCTHILSRVVGGSITRQMLGQHQEASRLWTTTRLPIQSLRCHARCRGQVCRCCIGAHCCTRPSSLDHPRTLLTACVREQFASFAKAEERRDHKAMARYSKEMSDAWEGCVAQLPTRW